MSEQIKAKIIRHLESPGYRPVKPRDVAKALQMTEEAAYSEFRAALRELMDERLVALGGGGTLSLPAKSVGRDEMLGSYRHNKRGFGFVVPTPPSDHEDLYIPEGENGGAINGDVVRAKITSRSQRAGKTMYTGRVMEMLERTNSQFVGSLIKQGNTWMVMPDGNQFTEAILTPDAATKYIKPGTKVVVEITEYPEYEKRAIGVITEVLGEAGAKDVDLKSVIVQHNLPDKFPEEVLAQARRAVEQFNPDIERENRVDLSNEVVCTIDPDDAKDYDDAISLNRTDDGLWELGVHIADVSFFVKDGSPLDVEAQKRGNSTYFPGFVIPMLPEVLSNGVCSLQEGVQRLCKSAFITLSEDARPVRTRFANTLITSRKRLRYREAQAIIDGEKDIPHPDGTKKISDYDADVVQLLMDMNALSKRMQKRRRHDGQIVLELPTVQLVLDDEGKVIDAVPEDQSFTHTLIEMFMVEANEAVARLLDGINAPFLRRVHPGPEVTDTERLRTFVMVAGHKMPKILDHKSIQALLDSVHGKPESFAINLAVLKSLSRAEYSPEHVGHYALASENYGHFTSPIRRYADLTIHRLLDAYFAQVPAGKRKKKVELQDIPSYDDLVTLGKHISFTERRSADAERELRQVKILTLLKDKIGETFNGVVTGVTNFGIFIQIREYLIDGLIRYEDLLDDWWDVDERAGIARGQRTGTKIGIGDVKEIYITKVDLARRELGLALRQPPRTREKGAPQSGGQHRPRGGGSKGAGKLQNRGGGNQGNQSRGGRGGNARRGGASGGGGRKKSKRRR